MNSIVFTFARMQPPTIGHMKLVQCVVETAKQHGAEHRVYLSQTHKAPTDPLEWSFKRRICESAFRGVSISKDASIRTPFQALDQLAENYNKIILVVGSDQFAEFDHRMSPYAKKMGIDFSVVSAGERIVESDDVSGMSASKMRQFAIDNEKDKFFNGLPTTLKEAAKELIYKNTIKGMKHK